MLNANVKLNRNRIKSFLVDLLTSWFPDDTCTLLVAVAVTAVQLIITGSRVDHVDKVDFRSSCGVHIVF